MQVEPAVREGRETGSDRRGKRKSEKKERGQRTEQRENGNAVFQVVWGSSLVVTVCLK